jgi:hypothetical protein
MHISLDKQSFTTDHTLHPDSAPLQEAPFPGQYCCWVLTPVSFPHPVPHGQPYSVEYVGLHTVDAGRNKLLGQVALDPVQYSAASHGPAGVLHM